MLQYDILLNTINIILIHTCLNYVHIMWTATIQYVIFLVQSIY